MKLFLLFAQLLIETFSPSMANVLVDPTKPAHTQNTNSSTSLMTKADTDKLVLNAIIQSPHAKQAIINGKLYEVGQSVSSFQLSFIGKNQVTLTSSSGNKTLFVNNSTIKKDVHNGF